MELVLNDNYALDQYYSLSFFVVVVAAGEYANHPSMNKLFRFQGK